MKNLFATFFLVCFCSIIGFAQTSPKSKRITAITTAVPFQVQKNCPDLAAHSIDFKMIKRYDAYSGLVRITGTVKNVGSQHFVSDPRQMSVVLYEVPQGGTPRVVARQSFGNIPSLRTAKVSFNRKWRTTTEFPPSYRLCVVYDPDIHLDNNPRNDDCNPSNNCKSLSWSDINKLFRIFSSTLRKN